MIESAGADRSSAENTAWWERWCALALGLWYAAYAASTGVVLGPDSEWYAQAARELRASGFDFAGHLTQAQSSVPIFYIAFTTVVAAAQSILGPHWGIGIVALNVAALTLSAYMAMRLAGAATGAWSASAVVLLLFAVLYEQIYWISRILTDTIFSFLVFAVFCAICAAVRETTASSARRLWMVATGVAILSVFFRPTGVVLLAWLPLAALVAHGGSAKRASESLQGPWLAAGGGMVAVCLALGIVFGVSTLTAGIPAVADYVANLMARGVVVDARPETYGPPALNALGAGYIVLKRLVYFFAFTADGFSVKHTVINALVFTPLYLLSGVACYFSFARKQLLSPYARLTARLAVSLVVLFAVFHALTVIDFDWRYRLPCYPPLAFLAGLGWTCVARGAARQVPGGGHFSAT